MNFEPEVSEATAQHVILNFIVIQIMGEYQFGGCTVGALNQVKDQRRGKLIYDEEHDMKHLTVKAVTPT